jgi:ferredoxin
MPTAVPHVLVVDQDNRLRHAIVDARVVKETEHCLTMWQGLQKLARGRRSPVDTQADQPSEAVPSVPKTSEPDGKAGLNGQGSRVIEVSSEVVKAADAGLPAADSGEPWIETDRCTSCNECTNVNSKMFAYNENKQAYITDPDAGTFRQLVEAAEGCQVSIIHPGTPRNPKEPGLDDLVRRAAEFN